MPEQVRILEMAVVVAAAARAVVAPAEHRRVIAFLVMVAATAAAEGYTVVEEDPHTKAVQQFPERVVVAQSA